MYNQVNQIKRNVQYFVEINGTWNCWGGSQVNIIIYSIQQNFSSIFSD